MKIKSLISFALVAALGLTGCASQPNVAKEEDRSEYLYLRGSFTWFDAEESYKVQRETGQIYKTVVELVADGQAYEFKFADESWSKGKNCGYQDKAQDEVVTIGNKVTANCSAKFEFFRFTPANSGKYNFFVDFSTSDKAPQIWITEYQPDLIDHIVDPLQKAMPDL
ncbi:hypothetical protein [Algibacillus agarilyticus]|uniref:hypothetical protein n=1 Tax=Algibacillus agarilyticus TaxID=2234133 RepID=UPI000DD0ABE8|nr:hypothetical protein [Algibacillus agarilyticus]